jgi:hypothetical protein
MPVQMKLTNYQICRLKQLFEQANRGEAGYHEAYEYILKANRF